VAIIYPGGNPHTTFASCRTHVVTIGACGQKRKTFSAYPWDRISYDITIKHLLKAVKTIDGKTTNLYGFSWAVMVVSFLQKKYKVFSKQVSSPRIFRWLLVTNNESIVHPWIIPTSSEMEMNFFTKFVPKKLTKDDKIEKLEMDLNGVVAIKRHIIIDEHNLDVEVEEHLLQLLREVLVVLVMEEEDNLLQMLIDVLMVLISKEEETSVLPLTGKALEIMRRIHSSW
ncbi:hypothetical protein H5410_004355, partial [Solanum commersonii]